MTHAAGIEEVLPEPTTDSRIQQLLDGMFRPKFEAGIAFRTQTPANQDSTKINRPNKLTHLEKRLELLTSPQVDQIILFLDYNVDRIFTQVRERIGDPIGSKAQMRQDILTYEGLRMYKDTELTTQDKLKPMEATITDASVWIASYILRVYESQKANSNTTPKAA